MRIAAFINNSSKAANTVIALFLIAAVGFLNTLTGWEIDFSIFYIMPIAFSMWFIGLRAGLIACILCTATWFWVDLVLDHPYTSEFAHFWNTLIRLLFFALFTFLLNLLKISHMRERAAARTDGLTAVVNSRYFYELLELETERSKRYKHPLTLAYIDLDNFKTVNDRFGHPAGDKALKTISDHMKKNLRTTDVLGRLGGDEFALLFPETSQDAVRNVISKLQHGLLQEMQQHGWPITFSIGVITCENVYPDVDDFIKTADELMYSVKNSSKNAIKYEYYHD